MVFSLSFSGLLVLAIIVIILLAVNLNYKNHCIEDLENRLCKESDRKNKDFVEVLKLLKKYQNFEPASRDTHTRRLINEAIQEYSNENSKFELALEKACEEYAKKELSSSDQTDR